MGAFDLTTSVIATMLHVENFFQQKKKNIIVFNILIKPAQAKKNLT